MEPVPSIEIEEDSGKVLLCFNLLFKDILILYFEQYPFLSDIQVSYRGTTLLKPWI